MPIVNKSGRWQLSHNSYQFEILIKIKRELEFKYVFRYKILPKMFSTFLVCSFYNLRSLICNFSRIYKFRQNILLNIFFIELVYNLVFLTFFLELIYKSVKKKLCKLDFNTGGFYEHLFYRTPQIYCL